MAQFPLHTRATAPFEAKAILDQTSQAMGYVPALIAQMAEAPALLEGYAALSAIFRKTAFPPAEQQLVLLTVSVEHESHYCTPAHTVRARDATLDEAVITAIRAGRSIADPRLEALRLFTLKMVRERGFLADADLDTFIAAGFTRANALEITLAVGLKTLSNYVNHIAETPLDPQLVADAIGGERCVA
ncbi:MAG: carboxymuconolactone decarboxylase family protein [Caulobacter sp.]|nr:carboxymuconolactone decarboxylase family protein [Caulobacter sp.]